MLVVNYVGSELQLCASKINGILKSRTVYMIENGF